MGGLLYLSKNGLLYLSAIDLSKKRIAPDAISEIVKSFVLNDDVEQAIKIVEKIEDEDEKSSALRAVAQAAAKLGDKEKALKFLNQALTAAEKIGSGWPKSSALRVVVFATMKIAETTNDATLVEKALKVAEKIENSFDSYNRYKAITHIAMFMAKAGNWSRARSIAELNTSDDGKAYTLAAIYKTWAERGEKEK